MAKTTRKPKPHAGNVGQATSDDVSATLSFYHSHADGASPDCPLAAMIRVCQRNQWSAILAGLLDLRERWARRGAGR